MTAFPSAQSLRVRAHKAQERASAERFVKLCERIGLPVPEMEHRFAAPRKWRFDFAWPVQRVALECEGGVWRNGAHTRGKHFMADVEKYNTAASLGWVLFRTVPSLLLDYGTLTMVGRALGIKLPPIGAVR